MFVHGIESHVAIITVLWLIGVPTNAAVIWIFTRKKNSQVAKNKFPLIFAVIDLIALLVALPMQPLRAVHVVPPETPAQATVMLFRHSVILFSLNGYLTTLLVATIAKFSAVVSPFKYRSKHSLFVKLAVALAFGVNLFLTAGVTMSYFVETLNKKLYIMLYSIAFLLIFLTIITLFVSIVAKLTRSDRKLRMLGKQPSGLVHKKYYVIY